MKTYLVISDLHVPSHCPKYVALITKVIRLLKPDGLVQTGDFVDWWQISTYDKDPARKNTIVDDIKEFEKILVGWAKELKRGDIHIVCGNHENRLSRYTARHAKELHEIVKSIPQMLELKEKNAAGSIKYHWHPYHRWNSCKIGDCVIMHGYYFNQHTASTNLLKYKTNILCGHTHRVQLFTDGVHYSATLGHGSNEKETAHSPCPTGWQQAFGILNVLDNGKTSLDIILVNDGKAVVYGKAL